MPTPASPPTSRVLDVLELLCRDDEPPKLIDVVRDLDLTQGTAHAIMTTLCERGWATRDPIDRTFAIGPGLDIAARGVTQARFRARAARTAARDLVAATGFAVSVTERVGDFVVVTAFEGGEDWPLAGEPGDRVPFAAPFGPAFAAFEDEAERRAWVERSGVGTPALARQLNQVLTTTRNRGYSIERNSPTLAQAAQLMDGVRTEPRSEPIRAILEELVVQITKVSIATDGKDASAISSMAAPVFDGRGRVLCNVAVHPYEPLGPKRVAALGRQLTTTTNAIGSRDPA